MSAYSELLGYFPEGSQAPLDQARREAALPPFEVTNQENAFAELEDKPTVFGVQPLPIHIEHSETWDKMLRGMDSDICPHFEEVRLEFRTTK